MFQSLPVTAAKCSPGIPVSGNVRFMQIYPVVAQGQK